MGNKTIIDKVNKNNLCIGCGMCISLFSKSINDSLKKGEDGFLHPVFNSDVNIDKRNFKKICPAYDIIDKTEEKLYENLWGNIYDKYRCASNDNEIKLKSTSGGVISTLAWFLLNNNIVDGILHVKGVEFDYEKNILKVSKSKNEILDYSSSRYAPADVFSNIVHILEKTDDIFCFIGKPCDITTLKRFLDLYPKYKSRIKLTIALFCAGIPSFNATKKVVDSFEPTYPVRKLVYRGDGWPGNFVFEDLNEKTFKMSYNDSWGKVLGRNLCLRCKLCPDGIGVSSDISVGDAWETINGYPDFTEREGQSLVLTRTILGEEIFSKACNAGYLLIDKNIEINIELMQPYQANRRRNIGARLLGFLLGTGIALSLNRKVIYKFLPFKSDLFGIVKEMLGTFLRVIK